MSPARPSCHPGLLQTDRVPTAARSAGASPPYRGAWRTTARAASVGGLAGLLGVALFPRASCAGSRGWRGCRSPHNPATARTPNDACAVRKGGLRRQRGDQPAPRQPAGARAGPRVAPGRSRHSEPKSRRSSSIEAALRPRSAALLTLATSRRSSGPVELAGRSPRLEEGGRRD